MSDYTITALAALSQCCIGKQTANFKRHIMKIGKLSSDVLGLVFFFLNVFAGIIGGVWLLLEGEWRIVIGGFIASLVMPFTFIGDILWLPSLGLITLMSKFDDKKCLWLILGFINSIYQSLIFSLWVVPVFFIFNAGLGNFVEYSESLFISIPKALLGYSVAVLPIAYMASYDPPDAIGAHSKRFLAQVEYILLFVLNLCGMAVYCLLGVVAALIVAEAIFVILFVRAFQQAGFVDESRGAKGSKETDREEHIQHRLQNLRRDYLYNPYEWAKEEYEEDDDGDTSVDMETRIAYIKGDPIDETERKKIERSHAIMEETDKRNEAEWEEIKHDAIDKVKAAIDDCKEKINSTKKNSSLVVLKDELEALYRFQDEISGEDKELESCSEDFQEKKKKLKNLLSERLTQTEKTIIVLYYDEEMTFHEISEALDIPESQVAQMHSSLVSRLKDEFNFKFFGRGE